jgi:hypothetical protein
MPIVYDDRYILRPGHQVEFTREMVMVLQKCASDILYFAENYFTIVHPTKGKMVITLYDFQKELLSVFARGKRSIICSGRQLGKTTCSCIYLLWYSLFNADKDVAILANKQSTAASIISDIKEAYEQLPPWMKPGVKKYDNLTIIFDNGTKIYARATSPDALRGESVSLMFLDEFAFVPENIAEDFWASQLPTLSTGGSVIIVSTPNGTAGLFYKLWKQSESKNSGWNNLKISWDKHPDRDENWKEQTIKDLGSKVQFAKEHACSFTGSSYTLIDADVLTKLFAKEPTHYTEEGYYIWKKPVPGHLYMAGIDVAKGANSDYHVINIYDITNFFSNSKYEQVALYRRNDISVFDFQAKCVKICNTWNEAIAVVENNDLGHVVVQNMYYQDGYENTWYDYEKGEYGIRSTQKTKPLAISYFKEDIESSKMIINADIMITELSYYEEIKTGIFAARNGRDFHDDTISSGYWVSFALRSRWVEDYYEWWLKNNNPNHEKLLEYAERENQKVDLETADGFLKALGGFSGIDRDMENFRKDLSSS